MEELWFGNDDIPVDVLSRLPTITLLGLKCVSKQWHHLLSDRSFMKVHTRRNKPSISGFFFQERFQWCDEDIKSISYIPIKMEGAEVHRTVLNFLPESIVMMASSNGLICCRSCLPSPEPKIYVCNPSNKEWVSLQFPTPDVGKSLALAFDPYKEWVSRIFPTTYVGKSIALAFDPFEDRMDFSTNFKVVRVCQTKTNKEESFFSFDIYSSATGTWRRSTEICKCNHNLFKNKGIFVEGVLYWLTDGDQVVMLDLKKELSLLIMEPLPSSQFNSIPEMCIGESEGQLHYVLISEYGLQLWVLEDHFASRWELKHSIALDKLEEENSQLLYNIRERMTSRLTVDSTPWIDPLVFKDGLLFMRLATDIILYHFETRKMERIINLSVLGPYSYFSPIVLPYATSLVPLVHE